MTQETEAVEPTPEAEIPAVETAAETAPEAVADAAETDEAATEEAAATNEGEEGSEKPLRDEKGKFKGVQARIDELTRARRDAERSAEYWKGLATHATAPDTAPEAAAKPTSDQFDDYDAYIEALTDWKVEQKTRDVAVKATENAETMHRQANWDDRQIAAIAILPDYNDVVGSSEVRILDHVQDAVMESERGPELVYQMAKNPALADQLNKMSPSRAALELGRLEASLETPVAKSASKAPAPITPIVPGGTTKVDLSKADMDTYIAERRKQGASY